MIHTIIVGRRTGRLGLSSLWLLIGLSLTLLVAGCGSGGSSNGTGGNGPGGNGPPSCDVNVASGDCDEDGVLNGEDKFPRDACASVDDDDDGAADMAHSGVAACSEPEAVLIDNCIGTANGDQANSDTDPDGDACDTDDDNDGVLDDDDEFPLNASLSCTVTDGNSGPGTTADCDNDSVLNNSDVDADGDGLIEIATSEELNNVRHNLMGTSYDDEEADTSPGDTGDTTGCPTTGGCTGYELSDNIALTSITNWQPIGTASARFRANFDGNDFMVSNMAIDTGSVERIGLFGEVGGSDMITIRNLHVQGSIVYSGSANVQIGGLAGSIFTDRVLIDGCSSAVAITGGSDITQSIGGLIGANRAIVQNSWATGAIHSCGGNTADSDSCAPDGCACEGGGSIGGLIGQINASRIRNSYATGDVRGNGTFSTAGVGGLVGWRTDAQIEDSYATGAVVGGSSADNIGGLAGGVSGSAGNIVRSYATGTVDDGDDDSGTATADNIGGLVGQTVSPNLISDSYYSGMVGTITDGGVSTTGDRVSNAVGAAQIPQSTPADLQTPTSVGGIYSAWSTSDWDFGSASQFPALKSTDGDLLCSQPAPRVQCSS